MPENDEASSRSQRPKGRTFSFNFSFGKKPPIDDPRLQELLKRALADAANSEEGRTSATYAEAFDRTTGEKLPADDPRVQELLELARAAPPDLPDGAHVTTNTETFTLDVADGKLRIGHGEPRHATDVEPKSEDPAKAREAEMWDRLELIAKGKGAYPDTARWHARLSMFVWMIAIALPLATLILTIAAGESQETIVFMTFGAAVIAAMLRGSIR